jgi:twin arginine-targeting protein translocase, TatA/E family
MFNLGFMEVLIILLIILILFGPSKLPELAKGMGNAIKEFKKAVKEESTEEKKNEESK